MNNPKQILGTDLNSMPPKNYLWQKEDGIYACVNGNGIKTKSFGSSDECGCEEEQKECFSADDISNMIMENAKAVLEDNGIEVSEDTIVYPDKYFVSKGFGKMELTKVSDFINQMILSGVGNITPAYCTEPSDPQKVYMMAGGYLVPGEEAGIDMLSEEINGETVYFLMDHNNRPK